MFFSLGTLRAVDIKKLSMRLRTPPHLSDKAQVQAVTTSLCRGLNCRTFTHLVPPTRTISQSSLYPQNPAKCSAWSQQVKSHLNEGCWHNLIWYHISTLSDLPSPSSILLLSLHCKIAPKVFTVPKTSTPRVPPITLIPQTHLMSYSTLDSFWNFLHSFNSHFLSTWCSGLWWYTSEPWRQSPSFTDFPVLGKGRKDLASERQRA